jgi:hypothetical protein
MFMDAKWFIEVLATSMYFLLITSLDEFTGLQIAY